MNETPLIQKAANLHNATSASVLIVHADRYRTNSRSVRFPRGLLRQKGEELLWTCCCGRQWVLVRTGAAHHLFDMGPPFVRTEQSLDVLSLLRISQRTKTCGEFSSACSVDSLLKQCLRRDDRKCDMLAITRRDIMNVVESKISPVQPTGL